jgi:hypothetical protein
MMERRRRVERCICGRCGWLPAIAKRAMHVCCIRRLETCLLLLYAFLPLRVACDSIGIIYTAALSFAKGTAAVLLLET